MEYVVTMQGDTLEASFSGEMNYKCAKDFRDVIDQFNKQNAKNITLDFGGLSFIDSTGMGAVVKAFDATKKNGGKLSIINAKGSVMQSLKMSHFHEIADLV